MNAEMIEDQNYYVYAPSQVLALELEDLDLHLTTWARAIKVFKLLSSHDGDLSLGGAPPG